MVSKFKWILFFSLLHINTYGNEILYNKDGIIVSNQDLVELKIIEPNEVKIDNELLLKKLILIKKTNIKLIKKNKKYYDQTIQNIKSKNIVVDDVSQKFLEEYLFFINVKNDIAREYFSNNADSIDISKPYEVNKITLGLSNDSCMTVLRALEVKNLNPIYIEQILSQKFSDNLIPIIYENKDYDLCVTSQQAKVIINILNNYLLEISKNEFLNFIYDKN
tara:strand:- start:3465 stop:4124 length:660 start_codon:yes stop_codon:yes gene_type:complete